MKLRRIVLALALSAAAALGLSAAPAQASPHSPHTAATNPAYVTILFSRTEEWPAVNCQPDAEGGVSLTQTVAPFMAALGMAGTGTVNTPATPDTEYCTHNESGTGTGETLASGWADLTTLASQYGWTFGPHEYDGIAKLATLTPYQLWNVTCGQAQTLTAHGLGPGTGMIAYPGAQKPQNNPTIEALQAQYGQNCFDWARTYDPTGVTTQADAQTAPYWQRTLVLKGGPGTGSTAYTDPNSVIAKILALRPGQWLTIQVYLLVAGTNPPGDPISWSCDQLGVANTSSDVERYCWSDLQKVLTALAADPGVQVTDPLTVGTALGRTAPGMPPPSKR